MPSNEDLYTPQEPAARALGGWLILPLLGLIVTFILAVVWMFTDYLPLLDDGSWADLPTSGRSLITFEVFANLVFIVGAAVLVVLVFVKRRIVPRLMVGFYGFVLLAVVADSIGILVIGPQLIPDAAVRDEVGWAVADVMQSISRAILASAIWIPYFLTSTRVKATFVNPRVPQTTATDAGLQPAALPVIVGTVTPTALRTTAATKSRIRAKWILGVSLAATLAVLALLVWQCAAPSGHTSASGDPQTKTYTDPDYGFSVDYPAGWRLREDETVDPASADSPLSEVSAFDPQGAHGGLTYYDLFAVAVFDIGATVDRASLPDIKAYLESYLAESMPAGSEPLTPLTEAQVGDTMGFTATFTDSLDGTPLKSTAYWLYKGSMSYYILLQSASSTWESRQATFQEIIASFNVVPTQ